MNEIEEIFDSIILEARSGNIDCGSLESLYFNTLLQTGGKYQFYDVIKQYPEAIPPTLKIQNKKELLIQIGNYLELARNFYTEKDFEYVTDRNKYIITLVMQNMDIEDFQNPTLFFQKRTNFLLDKTLQPLQQSTVIGHSFIFNADICVEIKKEPIFLETPYGMYISLIRQKESGGKLCYPLQAIRFGISDSKAYIYAIQKDKEEQLEEDYESTSFYKKIKRTMYKTGSGFQEKNMSDDDFLNLQKVSPWTLVATVTALGILKSRGIEEIVVPPFLINRFNGAHVMVDTEIENWSHFQNEIAKQYINQFQKARKQLYERQLNITDKFVRTFFRLAYHFPNFVIDEEPLNNVFPFHLKVTDEICNNPLLEELFKISSNYQTKKKTKSYGFDS